MCGIIGYTGVSDIIPALVEGLERLEYRGYDSAGVALAEKDGLRVVKSVGRISNLAEKLSAVRTDAHCGIGHTRWATHGRPTEINCHPHLSFGKKFAVVHNGIIENCRNLDKLCRCRGITPVSDTDSELIAHLLELNFDGDVLSAVRRTAEMLEGSFAVAALYAGSPNEIYAFRRSSPLIVGVGDGMCCLASDGCAARTEREYILGDGQYARLSPHGAVFFSRGKSVSPKRIPASDALSCERGGHPHFMIKEIAEQPEAAARTIESVRGKRLRGEVLYLGCGSSYNAALAAIPLTERQTGERAFAMTASEFLFSEKLSGRGKTAVLLSQSGETADTVAAALQAKRRGYRTVCISNVARSSLTRACERSVLTHAGPEISVATTKGFTSQEAALAALYVGSNADEVRRLPFEIERALDCDGDAILLKVDQVGAACHTGHYSCFFNPLLTLSGGRSSTMGAAIVQAVYDQVLDRKPNPTEGSYTNKLLEKGVDKIGKKVVEEVRFEVADLMYHLTVLLADQGMSWDDIYAELENRHR